MRVLHCSAEIVPLAKVGGLADLVGSLPPALKKLGIDTSCIIPYYADIDAERFNIEKIAPLEVQIGWRRETGAIYRATFAAKIPIYLVRCDRHFNREGIYGVDGIDHEDNHLRYSFFSAAVLEICEKLKLRPDIIHAHDWTTALVPVYLRRWAGKYPSLVNTRTVLTIHNIGYQGVIGKSEFEDLGLSWELFNPERLEFYGKVNLLKGGLVYADALTTVSKTYAEEIQTANLGYGLEGVLQAKNKSLRGIQSGIDIRAWDPECDKYIKDHFDADSLDGKKKVKATLQKRFSLTVNNAIPLFVFIGRFVDQKGFDILLPIMEKLVEDKNAQFVFIGIGEKRYHDQIEQLIAKHHENVATYERLRENMIHLIGAGADFILLPSLYEPSGVSHLYAMRYGTIPIARATGGLNDTIIDLDEDPENGYGFKFKDYNSEALQKSMERALKLFRSKKNLAAVRKRAMKVDSSWSTSALAYKETYERLLKKKKIHSDSREVPDKVIPED
jgi:starch synthase